MTGPNTAVLSTNALKTKNRCMLLSSNGIMCTLRAVFGGSSARSQKRDFLAAKGNGRSPTRSWRCFGGLVSRCRFLHGIWLLPEEALVFLLGKSILRDGPAIRNSLAAIRSHLSIAFWRCQWILQPGLKPILGAAGTRSTRETTCRESAGGRRCGHRHYVWSEHSGKPPRLDGRSGGLR